MAPFMPWLELKYEGKDARFEKMRPSKERRKNVLDCNVVGSEREVQQSAKREIKRRYRVLQSFRSRELMLRLSRASLMEVEGQWC